MARVVAVLQRVLMYWSQKQYSAVQYSTVHYSTWSQKQYSCWPAVKHRSMLLRAPLLHSRLTVPQN